MAANKADVLTSDKSFQRSAEHDGQTGYPLQQYLQNAVRESGTP